jgi:transcriptional regulator with XRE-family HTH domain
MNSEFLWKGIDMYEIFQALLDERKLKASDVARETKIPGSTFTDWKKGRSAPKLDKLQKIASYFGVSVEVFTANKADRPASMDPAYFKVMENAKKKGYSPEDLQLAIDFLDRARKRDND